MFEIKLKEAEVNPFLPICYMVGMVFLIDIVAQQVEHNTFNVGVLGSSPSGVTNRQRIKKQKSILTDPEIK